VVVRLQCADKWVEIVRACTATNAGSATDASADRCPNSSIADCNTDGSTDRFPTDSCADCNTDGSTADRCTDPQS